MTKRRRAPMVQAWARNIKPWIADDEDRELAARPVNEVLAGLIGPVLTAMAGGTESGSGMTHARRTERTDRAMFDSAPV